MSNNPFEQMINALDVIIDPKKKMANKPNQKKSIDCECGGRYTKLNKTNHMRTIRHKKFLETGEPFKRKLHWQLSKLCDLPEEDQQKKRQYCQNYYQQIAKPKIMKLKSLITA